MKLPFVTSLKYKFSALSEPVRIGLGLGVGFAGTLLVMVLVMTVGFGYMARIYADLEQVSKVNNVKTELAHKMKYVQRERALSLYALAIVKDPFEADEELQHFNQKAREFLLALEEFRTFGMNEQEQDIFDKIMPLTVERGRIVRDAIAFSQSHQGVQALEYMRKVAIPGQQGITGQVDKLLNLQESLTQQAVVHAEESYYRARLFMLVLCSIAIAIGVLVATVVLRHVVRQSRDLEQKALFDDLTKLPNRSLFFDRLGQAAVIYGKEKKPFSIVIFDLDRFKEVNDIQGHHVGDLLLKYVAQKVTATMRKTDTVARLGGDEFGMLLPGVSADSAEVIVKKIMAALNQRVMLEDFVVDCASSMGIASYPEHDEDIPRLLLKADVAMYAAKRANVGYRIYTPEIEVVAARNTELQHELRNAIEIGQLQLYFQPKISHHTGCIVGVEALVRWNHPERGLVPPDDFIPLAEATGLIQPLTLWVLQSAIEQSVKWHEAGHVFTIAINLSTRNLLDGDLPGRIAKLIVTHRAKPEWLILEITESSVMAEPARALETLVKLNKMGIQLSLDDFGTGYSSLAYLKKLPVSEIKIDKSFIKDLEIDTNDTVIVRSTIALGHNLGMKVVAEGVENIEIWELLTALGCDSSQGYYMSRPITVSALDEWLVSSAWAKEKTVVQPRPHFIERRRKQFKTPKDVD